MKTLRELYIKVGKEHASQFFAAIDRTLSDGWYRDKQTEKSVGGHRFDQRAYYSCDKRNTREAALLSLERRDEKTMYVCNIVPKELPELKYGQYNQILMDFHNKVLRAIEVEFPMAAMATSDELRIENLISPTAMRCLEAFSAAANKSTGSGHPCDRERWLRFLIALHEDEHRLSGHQLFRWLTEVEGWGEEVAYKLVSQFDFANDLLKEVKNK